MAPFFELESFLAASKGTATSAFHKRAEQLLAWHQALTQLLADPRLRGFAPSGQYSPAVGRYLQILARDYHRHRSGFEYAVTAWALGLQAPDSYPPESRQIDLRSGTLRD
ncbi:hypothetical protein AB0F20_05920 [Streptomyces goshikiensis]|uniref:hypothetical protein n=1 Tax=Streptomyces goshikiensis TaxID=1942 RepID=UPI0033ECE031